MRSLLASLVLIACMAAPACVDAQLFRNRQSVCPTDNCQPVTSWQDTVLQSSHVFPVAIDHSGPSSRAATQCTVGNGCGSGSICGYYKTGSLLLTNAHVAGTRPGTQVNVSLVVNNARKRLTGTLIMAAYSERTQTDWAIIYIADFREITPVLLSKNRPTGLHYTTGSPRCVWPLVSSTLTTADIADNSPLWRWRPNSIGGQSGSGVWSKTDHLQYGLLTWSWGGLGAGQQTHQIYRQATERSIAGPERIPGMIEVGRNPDVIIEEGFFSQVDIDSLPIWAGETPPTDPVDPVDPAPCDLSPEDLAIFKSLLKALEDRGLNKDEALKALVDMLNATGETNDPVEKRFRELRNQYKDRNYDWIEIINLIMQLIKLFSKSSIELPDQTNWNGADWIDSYSLVA